MSEIRYITAPVGAELVDRGLQVVPERDIDILPTGTQIEVLFSLPEYTFLAPGWSTAAEPGGSPTAYLRISTANLKTKTTTSVPVTYALAVNGQRQPKVNGAGHVLLTTSEDDGPTTLVIIGEDGTSLVAIDFHHDRINFGTWPEGEEWVVFAAVGANGVVQHNNCDRVTHL